MDDQFEWDEAKRLANIEKHNIDFVDMREVFDDRPTFTNTGQAAEEERYLTTGLVNDVFFTVVWTVRGSRIRIISARRARDAERRAYRELHGERT